MSRTTTNIEEERRARHLRELQNRQSALASGWAAFASQRSAAAKAYGSTHMDMADGPFGRFVPSDPIALESYCNEAEQYLIRRRSALQSERLTARLEKLRSQAQPESHMSEANDVAPKPAFKLRPAASQQATERAEGFRRVVSRLEKLQLTQAEASEATALMKEATTEISVDLDRKLRELEATANRRIQRVERNQRGEARALQQRISEEEALIRELQQRQNHWSERWASLTTYEGPKAREVADLIGGSLDAPERLPTVGSDSANALEVRITDAKSAETRHVLAKKVAQAFESVVDYEVDEHTFEDLLSEEGRAFAASKDHRGHGLLVMLDSSGDLDVTPVRGASSRPMPDALTYWCGTGVNGLNRALERTDVTAKLCHEDSRGEPAIVADEHLTVKRAPPVDPKAGPLERTLSHGH